MTALAYPQARDAFLAELVRAPNTVRNYARGLDLFIASDPPPLADLDAAHRAVLVRFVQWLLDRRGLKPVTVRLYATAVRRWFIWLGVNDHLPPAFPLAKALAALDDALRGSLFRADRRAPEPPADLDRVVGYYDTLTYCGPADPDRARRWTLETLRNRVLLRALAETGGRVSEVVALRVSDFSPACFEAGGVWRVEVEGKGRHRYCLRFYTALAAVRDYLDARARLGDLDEGGPLFVHHSKRYGGTPLTRRTAWRVVQTACRALGVAGLHPHDFRHHRASELVNAGVALDVAQDYLGHRNVETTRAYYARTKEARVDEAARTVKPAPTHTERPGYGNSAA